MSAPVTASGKAGRHDAGLRRKAARKGRERGCSLYIAADELAAAGIDPYGPAPLFRVWSGRKRTLMIALYPQPATPADEGGTANDR